jgi:hypothetical protein
MELALIFGLQLLGLVVALALARPLFGAEPSAGVRRVVAAVGRATQAFTLRALGRGALVTGLGALGLGALGLGTGRTHAGLAELLGAVAGATLAGLTALLAELAGTRATTAVVVALHRRFELALSTSLRSAGAVGMTSQALAVLGALAVVAVGHWLATPEAVATGHAHAVVGLPGYVLGAALVALTLAQSSGAYASAARAGELRAALTPSLAQPSDTQNPALVSAVVGERLEHAAGATRLFALSAAGAALALLLAASDGVDSATFSRRAALPLLLWAFGLVANGAGLFAARALEAEGAGPALARGQASVAAVWAFGLVGAGYWLAPDVWPPLAAAAALGLVGGALGPWSIVRGARRQAGPLRDALDALRGGTAPAQATALGFGLLHSALGLAGIAALAVGAARLGAHAQVSDGERSALLLAFFGATAWSPYALGVESSSTSAETARRVAALGGADAQVLQRAQRLSDSQAVPGSIARCHASFAAGLAALAAALLLARPAGAPGTESAGWVVLLGAAWTLAVAGSAARRASHGAREASLEVERQLGSNPAENAGESRAPSYRGCEEVAGRAGLAGSLRAALGVVLGPVVLGIAWKVVYRESGPRLAAEALATFVAGAAVTALGVALTVDGARAVLAGARRANRPEGDPATYAASVTGDALSDILRSAVTPAACTLALVATSLVLLARTLLP